MCGALNVGVLANGVSLFKFKSVGMEWNFK